MYKRQSLYDAVSSIYGYDGSTGGAANPSPVPQPDLSLIHI